MTDEMIGSWFCELTVRNRVKHIFRQMVPTIASLAW